MASWFQGFKDFIQRGNVIDLAIAVVIGAAFGAVVKAFTDFIINPMIAAIGGAQTAGLGFFLREGNDKTFVDFGSVIGALIQFLITAAVVYYVFVVPMNRIRARQAAKIDAPAALPADVALLTEIRDLLAARPVDGGAGKPVA